MTRTRKTFRPRAAHRQILGKIATAIDLLKAAARALDQDRALTTDELRAVQVDLENAERTAAIAAQDIAEL